MKPDLESARKVLESFLDEIESVTEFRKSISAPMPADSFLIKDRMPEFDLTEFSPAPDSEWEKENAYIWLYAEARDVRQFMHRPKAQSY